MWEEGAPIEKKKKEKKNKKKRKRRAPTYDKGIVSDWSPELEVIQEEEPLFQGREAQDQVPISEFKRGMEMRVDEEGNKALYLNGVRLPTLADSEESEISDLDFAKGAKKRKPKLKRRFSQPLLSCSQMD